MPRTVWGVRCDSIPRRSRSLAMRKPAVSWVVAIAHLILCRKTFDGNWRPQLTMRILIAAAYLFLFFAAMLLISFVSAGPHPRDRVTVSANEQARRVDIAIDGQPFTSYIWPATLKKPVLYPLRTAKGTIVTRGFPLEQRPGERVDHPHHVGLWLNYESVNGVDFWNNSDALKPDEAAKMGTIFHRKLVSSKSGADRGEVVTEMDWVLPGGKTILHERAQFVFAGDAAARRIERVSTLTALDDRVVFADAKDGMLGMRVARPLEQPSNEPQVYTDIAGR